MSRPAGICISKEIEFMLKLAQVNQFEPEFVLFIMFEKSSNHPVFASAKYMRRSFAEGINKNSLEIYTPFVVLKTSLLFLPASSQ